METWQWVILGLIVGAIAITLVVRWARESARFSARLLKNMPLAQCPRCLGAYSPNQPGIFDRCPHCNAFLSKPMRVSRPSTPQRMDAARRDAVRNYLIGEGMSSSIAEDIIEQLEKPDG